MELEELLKLIGGKKSKTFIDESLITETEDEMEFDNFSFNDQDFYEWLENEFRNFIRDKKINDILN